jgi:hypothetical protein
MEITNKRLDGETFKKYRERLKETKRAIKTYLKGSLLWDSLNKGTRRGSFDKYELSRR